MSKLTKQSIPCILTVHLSLYLQFFPTFPLFPARTVSLPLYDSADTFCLLTESEFMNYIVLDLEWNQCPYGKKREDPMLPFEIIEIGAVKMDEDLHPAGSFHEIIQPVLYKRLHHMTRSVIHMTERDFDGKRTFPEVFRDFLAWCGPDPVFCTWGPGDLTELQRNVRWHIDRGSMKEEWPFPHPFFFRDIQKIFAYVYEERSVRRSLEWAVEFLKIDKQEQFHDAYSDAFYTAEILSEIPAGQVEKHFSVDTYLTPSNRKEEIFIRYEDYTKFISKGFRDRNDVMKDRVVSQTRCIICGKRAKKKIRWFSDGGRNYLCAAQCEEHGFLKGKARIRINRDGLWYAIRTIRMISEEEYESVRRRQEALRSRRKQKRLQ